MKPLGLHCNDNWTFVDEKAHKHGRNGKRKTYATMKALIRSMKRSEKKQIMDEIKEELTCEE